MIESDKHSQQTFSGTITTDYKGHSQVNITETVLILDTQKMFPDLLVPIVNELVFHFNYSSFPGSNFYSFKTSLYMLCLKAN